MVLIVQIEMKFLLRIQGNGLLLGYVRQELGKGYEKNCELCPE